MNPFLWLSQQCNQRQDNLQRIAELIAVNGGSMVVKGFGKPVPHDHKYKRLGLTPPEALELCYMRGCLEGIILATNPACQGDIHELIRNEIEKTGIISVPTSSEVMTFSKTLLPGEKINGPRQN